jgi:phage tail-like protein
MKTNKLKILIKTIIFIPVCLLSLPALGQNEQGFYYAIRNSSFGPASFLNVSGLDAEISTDSNRFTQRVPTPTENLVLTRGTFFDLEKFNQYISQANLAPENLIVQLLNNQGEVVASWTFFGAYMISYEIAGNSENGELLVQSVSFGYQYFEKK